MAILDLLKDMYPMFGEMYEKEFGEKTTFSEKEENSITIKSLSNELITLKSINNLDEKKMSYLAEITYDTYLLLEKGTENIPKETYIQAIEKIKTKLESIA